MARPSPRRAKNIRAQLRIDPRSLDDHKRRLKRLESAVRIEVIRRALGEGGKLIQRAANTRAPGPHVIIEVLTGTELARGWRAASARGVKSDGIYVAIGPDRTHWYYRFMEYGVKAHSVGRRKRTRYQQHLGKQGVRISKARKYRTGAKQARTTGSTRPAMVFTIDGRLIFARKVAGFAARPFLRPAVDSQGDAAIAALGRELEREIKKAWAA